MENMYHKVSPLGHVIWIFVTLHCLHTDCKEPGVAKRTHGDASLDEHARTQPPTTPSNHTLENYREKRHPKPQMFLGGDNYPPIDHEPYERPLLGMSYRGRGLIHRPHFYRESGFANGPPRRMSLEPRPVDLERRPFESQGILSGPEIPRIRHHPAHTYSGPLFPRPGEGLVGSRHLFPSPDAPFSDVSLPYGSLGDETSEAQYPLHYQHKIPLPHAVENVVDSEPYGPIDALAFDENGPRHEKKTWVTDVNVYSKKKNLDDLAALLGADDNDAEDDFDPCQAKPCRNGGMCKVKGMAAFECICPRRFKGKYCQNKNRCHPNPCENDGKCTELAHGFECTCQVGFKGVRCQERNQCLPNPCMNDGLCNESPQGFVCTCQEGYQGKACEERRTVCTPNPCLNGGKCAPDIFGKYQCICESGYSGKLCEEFSLARSMLSEQGKLGLPVQKSVVESPINSESTSLALSAINCLNNPCMNSGVCKPDPTSSSGFQCECSGQYKGLLCEEQKCKCENGGNCIGEGVETKCACKTGYAGILCADHTQCNEDTCMHGGICIEQVGGFKCKCDEGYKGVRCEISDRCNPNPCLHGGKCKEYGDFYKCECPPTYIGKQCEDLNFCFPNPCKNNGKCLGYLGGFQCDCPDGFTGKACGRQLYCRSNPCRNRGKCDEVEDGFTCTCIGPYQGKLCEVNNFCFGQPCLNGGTCSNGREGFICKCSERYKGKYCNVVDKCFEKPCKNGARCITENSGDYRCDCLLGFTGKICDTTDPCQPNPCHEGGNCITGQNGGFSCQCREGYRGVTCTEQDPCHPNPCAHGTCAEINGGYVCNCTVGFRGPTCSEVDRCSPNPCFHNGQCKEIVGGVGYVCECPLGYKGQMCDLKDRCRPNPCQHDGTCQEVTGSDIGYMCKCTRGFRGTHCQAIDPCFPNPCNNNGHCMIADETSHKCNCSLGYKGPKCDDIDLCSPNPCRFGTHCIQTDQESYQCVKNLCIPSPCMFSGKCIVVNDETYECACPKGRQGKNCEEQDSCYPNPCENGGSCSSAVSGQFKCACSSGYTGKSCTEMSRRTLVDFCSSAPCKNGGTCVNTEGGFTCRCEVGFSGPVCEESVCLPNPCENAGTCVPYYGIALCKCRDQFTGAHCSELKIRSTGPLKYAPPPTFKQPNVYYNYVPKAPNPERTGERKSGNFTVFVVGNPMPKASAVPQSSQEPPNSLQQRSNSGTAEQGSILVNPSVDSIIERYLQNENNARLFPQGISESPQSITLIADKGSPASPTASDIREALRKRIQQVIANLNGGQRRKEDNAQITPVQSNAASSTDNTLLLASQQASLSKPGLQVKGSTPLGSPAAANQQGQFASQGQLSDTQNEKASFGRVPQPSSGANQPASSYQATTLYQPQGATASNLLPPTGKLQRFQDLLRQGHMTSVPSEAMAPSAPLLTKMSGNSQVQSFTAPSPQPSNLVLSPFQMTQALEGSTASYMQAATVQEPRASQPLSSNPQLLRQGPPSESQSLVLGRVPFEQKVKKENSCEPNPCKNGGTCLVRTDKTLECVCPNNSSGPYCQDIGAFGYSSAPKFFPKDECKHCDKNALCTNGHCICKAGFVGDGLECWVQSRKDTEWSCATNPCMNGGTCKPGRGRCVCRLGFTGDFCENYCPPVVHLSFDHLQGSLIQDESSNDNDATLANGAAVVPMGGKCDSAVSLSGGDILFDGQQFWPKPVAAVTMALWIKLDTNKGIQSIFDSVGGKYSTHHEGQYHFEIEDGKIRWFHRNEKHITVFSVITEELVKEGRWNHIVGTYESKSGEAKVFLNGDLAGEETGSGYLSQDWLTKAGIGKHEHQFGNRLLRGMVDEFYIFACALPRLEILVLMSHCKLYFGGQGKKVHVTASSRSSPSAVKAKSPSHGAKITSIVTQIEPLRVKASSAFRSRLSPKLAVEQYEAAKERGDIPFAQTTVITENDDSDLTSPELALARFINTTSGSSHGFHPGTRASLVKKFSPPRGKEFVKPQVPYLNPMSMPGFMNKLLEWMYTPSTQTELQSDRYDASMAEKPMSRSKIHNVLPVSANIKNAAARAQLLQQRRQQALQQRSWAPLYNQLASGRSLGHDYLAALQKKEAAAMMIARKRILAAKSSKARQFPLAGMPYARGRPVPIPKPLSMVPKARIQDSTSLPLATKLISRLPTKLQAPATYLKKFLPISLSLANRRQLQTLRSNLANQNAVSRHSMVPVSNPRNSMLPERTPQGLLPPRSPKPKPQAPPLFAMPSHITGPPHLVNAAKITALKNPVWKAKWEYYVKQERAKQLQTQLRNQRLAMFHPYSADLTLAQNEDDLQRQKVAQTEMNNRREQNVRTYLPSTTINEVSELSPKSMETWKMNSKSGAHGLSTSTSDPQPQDQGGNGYSYGYGYGYGNGNPVDGFGYGHGTGGGGPVNPSSGRLGKEFKTGSGQGWGQGGPLNNQGQKQAPPSSPTNRGYLYGIPTIQAERSSLPASAPLYLYSPQKPGASLLPTKPKGPSIMNFVDPAAKRSILTYQYGSRPSHLSPASPYYETSFEPAYQAKATPSDPLLKRKRQAPSPRGKEEPQKNSRIARKRKRRKKRRT